MRDTSSSCPRALAVSRSCLIALAIAVCTHLDAQTTESTSTPPSTQSQLEKIAGRLAKTEDRLQESQREIDALHREIAALRVQLAPATIASPQPASESSSAAPVDIADKVAVLQSQIEQHDQIKVESSSKYPVRLTGLILFNAFTSKGAVDNFDQPSIAIEPQPGTPTRASGASMRQTILGIQATGPHLLGASTSADLNVDFYGGLPYNNYGSTGGLVRLRTSSIRLNWQRDIAEVGLVEPLISPLSPTSYASVAEPAMAWAGNLWTWAPQLSYQHLLTAPRNGRFGWQFGLWDPPTAGYTNPDIYRVPSSGERSAQPAYESRLSYARGERGDRNQLQVGAGGYYSRQAYGNKNGDSWAVTGDWKIPISRFFEVSGEAYRGRALGGLGGGAYKDIVSGVDPRSGAPAFRLLNDAGGWVQGKIRFTPLLEANGAFGMDNGFANDFHSLVLPAAAGPVQLRARNQMVSANMIYKPRTYLVLSPEYRRIRTFPIIGPASTANLFTLSLGYRF